MKNKNLIIPLLFTIVIDIVSKIIVSKLMIENQSITIIKNFFNITYAKNTGVAFSFLEGNRIIIILITIIIIALLIKYIYNKDLSLPNQISFGLILGGAIGNLIDRIIYGYVIDFLDFQILNYDYPIFNIADSAIVIGVIIILVISIKKESSDIHENNSPRRRKN